LKSTFLMARDGILFVVQSFTDGLSFGFNNMSQVNFLQVKKITNKSFKYLF
jgi:hypothetical protein